MQIGPKIKIGGSLGHLGQAIKLGAGKALSNPIVDAGLAFIPGLGPIASAAAGGLGKALDTSHGAVSLGDIAKGAAVGGAAGYGATKLGGLVKSGIGALSGGGPISLGSVGSVLGGLKDGAGAVGDFLGNHQGLVDTGLGAAAALNAANLSKQSSQYAHNAMDTANQSYGSRAPLRLAGVQGMLHPTPTSDTARLSQISAKGNPFAGAPLPLRQVG